MSTVPFTKMHGAGTILSLSICGRFPFDLSADTYSAIADRHRGIGCDQIILIEQPQNGADLRFRFHNADGSEAGACGNGARCAASKVMAENGVDALSIETRATVLEVNQSANGEVTVDMGPALTDWEAIPL